MDRHSPDDEIDFNRPTIRSLRLAREACNPRPARYGSAGRRNPRLSYGAPACRSSSSVRRNSRRCRLMIRPARATVRLSRVEFEIADPKGRAPA
jgi:hypothetical protein